MDSTQNEDDLKVMSFRIKHLNWQVRKRAYEQILSHLQSVQSVKEQFKINSQLFTALKLTSMLNNLTEQKHPILVMRGLDCVLAILNLNPNAIKYFNQLVSQGLEKFPILTQQRNKILQKFMEFLYFFRDQQHIVATLNSKLSLPNEKVVMWAMEVIGELQATSLRKKLIEMSRKHQKKDVRELASQIAEQLMEGGEEQEQVVPKRKEEEVRPKISSKTTNAKKEQPRKVTQILQKFHHFETLSPKDQQQFSNDLQENADHIAILPNIPQLSNLSYFIQLMIEDNNQIISMNGIKTLTTFIARRSQLIPASFPLLFIFRKFKMHKTHATNANLLKLIEALLCSNRSNDLMSAIYEGMTGAQNKKNVRYGCIISFLRIFSYYYKDEQLFNLYCIGNYSDLGDNIDNRRVVEKGLSKCADAFFKQKEREYITAIERVREGLGMASSVSEPKSNKFIPSSSNIPRTKKSLADDNTKTQPISKPTKTSSSKPSKTKVNTVISPQGDLYNILQLTKSQKYSQKLFRKNMLACLNCLTQCTTEQRFDGFFYCEILQHFIDNYQSNQQWDQMISVFLIDYLKIVSAMPIKQGKNSSRVVEMGVDYLVRISICKLALGKQLLILLGNLMESVGFLVIFKSLGDLFVMQGQTPKKKNKKYLNRWLQENTPEQYVSTQYYQLRQAIQKKKMEAPPSIMAIPSYQQLKPKQQTKPVYKKMIQEPVIEPEPEIYQPCEQEQNNRGQQIGPPEWYRLLKESEKLNMLQNADISHIERVDEQQTDRLQQKWQYFLNKKGMNMPKNELHEDVFKKVNKSDHYSEQQKFDLSEHQPELEKQQIAYHFENVSINQELREQSELKNYNTKGFQKVDMSGTPEKYEQLSHLQKQEQNEQKEVFQKIKASDSGIKRYYQPQLDDQQENLPQQEEEPQQFKYVYLDSQRIIYMLHNSGKSFNHLRTLVFTPFKKHPNKHAFLRQLTHLIQSQTIKQPQPFKSLLLLVIILFTQIRNDKSIIGPLQFLYQHMAQMCSNNQFLKIIVGLYHCVIEESEQCERKMLLTILNKSIVRIMPYVENAWEMLKDFQQFYQIGQLVYFQMYPEQYTHIRQTLQSSDSLQAVIQKACEQQGQNILAMVQGWLDSNFKKVVKNHIDTLLKQADAEDDQN